MAEAFIPLATFVRAKIAPASVSPAPQPPVIAEAPAPSVVPNVVDFAHADLAGELSLLRIAAAEAFEAAARRALGTLADLVLARELALAPADLDALVALAVAEFAEAEPVALRVSALDADRVRAALPVRVDPALGGGDLVVEVRDGAVESTFAFRLEAALERAGRRA